MTDQEQIVALSNDLDALIERYRNEFDMTYSAVIGILNMKSWLLCKEAADRAEDTDE